MYWAVASTHPQAERKALDNLRRQGFVCYAPRSKELAIRAGRKVPVIRYLFPRYVFILIVRQWWAIQSTFGITKLIINNDAPCRLPGGWVEAMQAQEKDGVVVLPKDRYAIGQPVYITGGLFQGYTGLYQGMTSRQREVVLLGTLGRVELAAGDLE